MKLRNIKNAILLTAICLSAPVSAKVVLPSVFTDNMVLQQKSKVMLYGKALPNKKVSINAGWEQKKLSVKSDAVGNWKAEIATPSAGGPYEIEISDGKKIALRNILIGEVWFCSGQSNMEMPVGGWGRVLNFEKEIAEANYPSIRLFQVKKATSLTPNEDVTSNRDGWNECSPQSVPEFSSVAYFFARSLWNDLKIPIGVIDCTWGGTPAEAWTSYNTLKNVYGYTTEMTELTNAGFDRAKMDELHNQKMHEWKMSFIRNDKGYVDEKPYWCNQNLDDRDWKSMNLPGYWEGKGLPNFDGMVWFRKTIDIPREWVGKELSLNLGVIDDADIVFWNGEKIAEGSGYTNRRVYTVPTALVKQGKVVVTVRVTDTGGEGGIAGKADELFVAPKGENAISLAGDWKYNVGVSTANFPQQPMSPTGSPNYPTVLYNAMLSPLTSFPVKGAIWYQGESNTQRAEEYTDLFRAMILDWREKWNNPDMPFYFVQLANFMHQKEVQPESTWALLREAQMNALKLENTGMIVANDIGEAYDIHPKNKQEVARRLSLIALAETYGKEIAYSGPLYESYQLKNNKVEIKFTHIDKGMQAKTGTLKGFIIAGPDRVFYKASAVISGDKVIVSAPEVKFPVAVRYGWGDNIESTLYNQDGLPASPFRTDNWETINK